MRNLLIITFCLLSLTGCQSAYYSAMETVGVHKRDLLIEDVTEAKDAQTAAQKQFQTALQAVSEISRFNGGKLEQMYDKMKTQYENSQDAAKTVKERIEKVDAVSNALFNEWQKELSLYNNQSLKRTSEQQLRVTKNAYQTMIGAMKRSEKTMQPVLAAMHDNVLFLKHNLNANAISALKGEFDSLEQDIQYAITQMNTAIEQSNAFLAEIKQPN